MIREEATGNVCTITLERPQSKNALSTALLVALLEVFENAEKLKSHVIVLRGSGGTFCSGGDLIEFRESLDRRAQISNGASLLNEVILKMRSTRAIVIAVLEGVAAGAGLSLSLACDLSIATKETVLNMAYSRIALTPDGGASMLLPRLVGAKRFAEFYLLHSNISADEARALGIINIVCSKEELEGRLEQIIRTIKALPVETVGYFKDLTNDALFGGLDKHLEKERVYVADLAEGTHFKERLDRFFAKATRGE